MKIESLENLFEEQLQDLYSAENQIVKGLTEMIEVTTNPQLKQAFETHLTQTNSQIERLKQVFTSLGKKPGREKCKAMEGLIKETKSFLEDAAEDEVRDAGLIAMAQRIEHYEIAGYGTIATYAQILGLKKEQRIFAGILKEEKQTDQLLTKIAEAVVNVKAV